MKKFFMILNYSIVVTIALAPLFLSAQTWKDVEFSAHQSGVSTIKFYNKTGKYYEFTNYYGGDSSHNQKSCAIPLNDFLNVLNTHDQQELKKERLPKIIPTSEQIFHTLRILHSGLTRKYWHAAEILNYAMGPRTVQISGQSAKNVNSAGDAAREHFNFLRQNVKETDQQKQHAMLTALWLKFTTNHHLKKVLLDTNNALLIENTQLQTKYDDSYWGNGQHDTGTNHLGQMLMHLRAALKQNSSFQAYLNSYQPKLINEWIQKYASSTASPQPPKNSHAPLINHTPSQQPINNSEQTHWFRRHLDETKKVIKDGWKNFTSPWRGFSKKSVQTETSRSQNVQKQLTRLNHELNNLTQTIES